MIRLIKPTLVIFFCIAFVPPASALRSDLCDWALSINGDFYPSPGYDSPPGAGDLPDNADVGNFDWSGGLGRITITLNPGAAGNYFVGAYFDHEINSESNTYYNEAGWAVGTPAAGQSWEIDEPGFGAASAHYFGDIFANVQLTQGLDNLCYYDSLGDHFLSDYEDPLSDDVSWAIAWNFALEDIESAIISFYLSENIPSCEFYLEQMDTCGSIFFASTLDIKSSNAPEPGTLILLGVGLLCILSLNRKMS